MEDIRKKCCKCKLHKPLEEFNKCKTGTFGVHGHCKSCQKIFRHKWYLKHRQEEINKNKLPQAKEKARKYRFKKYHENDKWREICLEKNRNRRRLEPSKIKARIQRKKWYSLPKNRIACSLRSRLQKAIRCGIKINKTELLLGCSFETAKKYLESKFENGMSWNNYGMWHIDHIIPCNFFDLTIPENQKLCFNYRNLQPMWRDKNISKGSKVSIDNAIQFINELRSSLL